MASQERMRDLTVQVKRNSEDLHSYMQDLEGWQKDMEAKDNQLRGKTSEASVPAKRKGEKKEESKAETKMPKKDKEERIKSYEYKKWNDFDVEAELEKIEEGNGEDGAEEEGSVDEAVLLQEATAEKERGNALFKAGRYEDAVERYTRGIKCDPKSAVIVANRAMALLKLGKHESANADATVALSIDPTYTKAYLRRATARRELGDFEGALEDFEKVLELEPRNKQAKDEIERTRLREAKAKQEKEAPPVRVKEKDDGGSFGENIKAAFSRRTKAGPASSKASHEQPVQELAPGQVLPISKPPHVRSKKPLKQIEVTEVGDFDFKKRESEVMDTSTETSEPEKKEALQSDMEKEISLRLETSAKIGEDGGDRAAALVKPKTAVQFDAAWRRLGSPAARAKYLCLLRESDYPVVFKHSLEPKAFGEIVEALGGFEDAAEAARHLSGLAMVPRMSAIVMFMEDKEREAIGRILEAAARSSIEEKILRSVRKTFSV